MKKPTKKDLEDMINKGLTLKEMSSEYGGRSISWVRLQLNNFGIQKRSRSSKHWTEEEDIFLTEHYGHSSGVEVCCKKLGRKKDSIYQRAKKMGLTYKNKSDEYKKEDLIREYIYNKKSIKEIAEILGGKFWHVYGALIRNGIKIDKTGRYYGKDHHMWCGYGEIPRTHWGSIVKSAKRTSKRKIPFNITIEYGWDLYLKQGRKCELTGLDIKFSKTGANRYKSTTASLDRINSSLGYIEGNCQWVHKIINTMKMSLSQDEFIHYCSLVCKYNGEIL